MKKQQQYVILPCCFLLHERKFQSCHEELMREIAKRVQNLVNDKKDIPLVKDVGIYQVIFQK